jgi:ankyrin repeat protein
MRTQSTYLGFALAALVIGAASPASAADGQSIADAAQARDNAAVRALLSSGGEARTTQSDGTTALHWVAHLDELELAELLLGAGADRVDVSPGGLTPLGLARGSGHGEMGVAVGGAGA